MQEIIFTRIHVDIYSIQCSYLSGSDISGCVYILVSREEGVENVTDFIERDFNVYIEVANIGCYSEVLAYDNTTIGEILPVRTSITEEACLITTGSTYNHNNKFCIIIGIIIILEPPTISSTSTSSGYPTSTIIVLILVVVVVVMVAVVLAVMLFIVLSFMLYQNKGMLIIIIAIRTCTGRKSAILVDRQCACIQPENRNL